MTGATFHLHSGRPKIVGRPETYLDLYLTISDPKVIIEEGAEYLEFTAPENVPTMALGAVFSIEIVLPELIEGATKSFGKLRIEATTEKRWANPVSPSSTVIASDGPWSMRRYTLKNISKEKWCKNLVRRDVFVQFEMIHVRSWTDRLQAVVIRASDLWEDKGIISLI